MTVSYFFSLLKPFIFPPHSLSPEFSKNLMGFFFPWENRRSQRRKLQIRNLAFIPCPAVSSSYFAFPPTISVLTHPSKANSSTCVGNPVPLTYSRTLLSNSFFPLLHQIITLCWILSISTKTCYYFLYLLKKIVF